MGAYVFFHSTPQNKATYFRIIFHKHLKPERNYNLGLYRNRFVVLFAVKIGENARQETKANHKNSLSTCQK